MDKNLINKSIQLGREYLINNLKPSSGKFNYIRTKTGEIIKGKYNYLRHFGSLWSINVTRNGEPTLTQLKILESHLKIGKSWALFEDKNKAKLGASALLLLYLKSICEPHDITPKLLSGLDFFYNPFNGLVNASKIDLKTMEDTGFISEYYPGELALALCLYDKYEEAYKIAKSTYQTRDIKKVVHDHWMLQALRLIWSSIHALQNFTKEEKDFILFYTNLLSSTIVKEPEKYIKRCCPIACRIEGLIPAYLITGNKKLLPVIEDLIERLLNFQNKDKSHKAYGAFIDHNEYRIDYTQHSICALNYAKNYL